MTDKPNTTQMAPGTMKLVYVKDRNINPMLTKHPRCENCIFYSPYTDNCRIIDIDTLSCFTLNKNLAITERGHFELKEVQ